MSEQTPDPESTQELETVPAEEEAHPDELAGEEVDDDDLDDDDEDDLADGGA